MPQSLSKIYLHIVFSTKHRHPFLKDPEIRAQLHAYMAGICRRQECPALIIGGVADHIHILCHFGRTITIADLVKEIKRSSSLWIKQQGHVYRNFAWQVGYGAFSAGYLQVNTVQKYIENQEAHHQRKHYQDEFRGYLQKYQIEYDERYVWD